MIAYKHKSKKRKMIAMASSNYSIKVNNSWKSVTKFHKLPSQGRLAYLGAQYKKLKKDSKAKNTALLIVNTQTGIVYSPYEMKKVSKLGIHSFVLEKRDVTLNSQYCVDGLEVCPDNSIFSLFDIPTHNTQIEFNNKAMSANRNLISESNRTWNSRHADIGNREERENADDYISHDESSMTNDADNDENELHAHSNNDIHNSNVHEIYEDYIRNDTESSGYISVNDKRVEINDLLCKTEKIKKYGIAQDLVAIQTVQSQIRCWQANGKVATSDYKRYSHQIDVLLQTRQQVNKSVTALQTLNAYKSLKKHYEDRDIDEKLDQRQLDKKTKNTFKCSEPCEFQFGSSIKNGYQPLMKHFREQRSRADIVHSNMKDCYCPFYTSALCTKDNEYFPTKKARDWHVTKVHYKDIKKKSKTDQISMTCRGCTLVVSEWTISTRSHDIGIRCTTAKCRTTYWVKPTAKHKLSAAHQKIVKSCFKSTDELRAQYPGLKGISPEEHRAISNGSNARNDDEVTVNSNNRQNSDVISSNSYSNDENANNNHKQNTEDTSLNTYCNNESVNNNHRQNANPVSPEWHTDAENEAVIKCQFCFVSYKEEHWLKKKDMQQHLSRILLSDASRNAK